MRAAAAVVVGMVIGAVGALTAQKLLMEGGPIPSPAPSPVPTASPGPSPLPSPMCDALVKLSLRGKQIVADPDNVCLAVGRSLSWDIVDAGDVEIDFKEQNNHKGPFSFDNTVNPSNTAPGKYNRNSPGRVGSNRADHRGWWKYTVRWKLPTGDAIPDLDPAVCVRD
jgi:hypothetical protein